MSYGTRSNAELVVHSGFYFAHHANDFMTVHLALSASDPLAKLRATLLTALGIQLYVPPITVPPVLTAQICSAGGFVVNASGDLDPQTIAFARILALNEGFVRQSSRHTVLTHRRRADTPPDQPAIVRCAGQPYRDVLKKQRGDGIAFPHAKVSGAHI